MFWTSKESPFSIFRTDLRKFYNPQVEKKIELDLWMKEEKNYHWQTVWSLQIIKIGGNEAWFSDGRTLFRFLGWSMKRFQEEKGFSQ